MLVKALCVIITRCCRIFQFLRVKPNYGLMGNIIKNLYDLQGLMKKVAEKFFGFPKLPTKENKGGCKRLALQQLGVEKPLR